MKYCNEIIVVAAFLLVTTAILVANATFLQITYYDISDVFGPLSVYPFAFIIQLAIPLIFLLILLRYYKKKSFLFLIPVLLLIMFTYVGVELSESSYTTSFYDAARGNIRNGLYVTATGHSDSVIHDHQDKHPGFFWGTAILLNVFNASISLTGVEAMLLLKWFPIFAILIYLPILYLFYRNLLNNTFLVSVALLLHFGLEILKFHYAAQVYGRAIYFLILAILFISLKKRDFKYPLLALLLGFSLIFVHFGLTILTIIAFLATVIYPMPFKIFGKDKRCFNKKLIALPLTLGIAWVSYLLFLTANNFQRTVSTIINVITTLFADGTQIISFGVNRPDLMWSQIVSYKAIYIFLLIALGLFISFVNAYRKRNDTDKLAFSVIFLSTAIFGTISVALGGAGYIERLLSMMLPLIVYSIVKYASSFKLTSAKKTANIIFTTFLIMSLIIGSAFYFSGRNFQSVTYSEHYSNTFLAEHTPQNILGIFPEAKWTAHTIVESELGNVSSIPSSAAVVIQKYMLIHIYYYVHADLNFINNSVMNTYDKFSVVYNNPTTVIVITNE